MQCGEGRVQQAEGRADITLNITLRGEMCEGGSGVGLDRTQTCAQSMQYIVVTTALKLVCSTTQARLTPRYR